MKHMWWKLGVSVGVALVTGTVVAACAHNDASIFIRQVFLPVVPSNNECTYTADISQSAESTGMADVSFGGLSTYTPVVLVGNQVVEQANLNQEQVETSRVIIHGAITRITDLDGNTTLLPLLKTMYAQGDAAAQATGQALQNGTLATPINPFSTVESTTVEPGTGTAASYAVLALTMLDTATMNVLRYYFEQAVQLNGSKAFQTAIQLLTYTKVEGTTLGGDAEESNEFEFPVTITYGALISNLYTDSSSAIGYCIYPQTVPTTAQACVPGQDAAIIISPGSLPGVPECVVADAATGGG